MSKLAVGVMICWLSLAGLAWAASGPTPWPRLILSDSEPPTPPKPDTQPPVVTVSQPTDGATVPRNSSVLVQVDASDNVSITRLSINVNGQTLCILFHAPYQCPWKVPGAVNVPYTITVQAMDQVGNNALAEIQVKSK